VGKKNVNPQTSNSDEEIELSEVLQVHPNLVSNDGGKFGDIYSETAKHKGGEGVRPPKTSTDARKY